MQQVVESVGQKQHKKQAEKPGQEQESEPTLWAFAALFPVQFLYKNINTIQILEQQGSLF